MCGISGVLAFKNSNFEVTSEFLVRMRETMIHRGPDGAGLWISPDRRVGLAHRRLSIIDLSDSASQPMSNADGSLQPSCYKFPGPMRSIFESTLLTAALPNHRVERRRAQFRSIRLPLYPPFRAAWQRAARPC